MMLMKRDLMWMNKNVKKQRYLQVYADLKHKVIQGVYPVGARIPVESELLKIYNVSITTIRKSIQMLCDESILHKRQGIGTFVVGSPNEESEVSDTGNLPEPVVPALRIAVVTPSMVLLTPEGDRRHWQLNLRRINGIYRAAKRQHVSIYIHDLSENASLTDFDGVIIFRYFELEEPEYFNSIIAPLEQHYIPYVVISEYDLRFAAKWWVVENLELEFYEAYRFLFECQYRRLLLIGPQLTQENPRIRALRPFAGKMDYEIHENDLSDQESGYAVMQEIIRQGKGILPYDAVFCTTDLQALGCMKSLAEVGIRIPEEMGIMGCDNLPESANCDVPLTTFQFSGPEVGESALDLVVRACREPSNNGLLLIRRGQIIIRDSIKLAPEIKSNV